MSVQDDPGPTLRLELRLHGDDLPPDCDTVLVHEGWATISLLEGITADPPVEGLLASLERARHDGGGLPRFRPANRAGGGADGGADGGGSAWADGELEAEAG